MILGTAGHIDHGKTALVRALTGVDTDRLAEEKRRGITIDLGFAPLALHGDVQLGVVDVPGHEAFVRNMLAGATGVDLALLVVAADEGVMPQTREHLAILGLLGIRGGVVAITKCDLVDADWLQLVREDVRTALAGTSLAGAPMVETSVVTGRGIGTLRAALADAARDVPVRDADDLFRLPIDRAFTIRGTGTVVTGTVWTGCATRDTAVRLLPGDLSARVRGIELHGAAVERALPGSRAALALGGVSVDEVHRGTVLVADPAWQLTRVLLADVALLADAPAALGPRSRVRFHLGTSEVGARVVTAGGALEPGARKQARVVLETPVVMRAGDRFVMRGGSPLATIGGGIVNDPLPTHHRPKPWTAAAHTPLERLRSVLAGSGTAGVLRASLPIRIGISPGAVEHVLVQVGTDVLGAGDRLYQARVARQLDKQLMALVSAHHARAPLELGASLQSVRSRLAVQGGLAEHVLTAAVQRGALDIDGGLVRLAGWVPRLDDAQRHARQGILDALRGAGREPPSVAELSERFGPDTSALLRLLERDGVAVQAEQERYYDRAVLDSMVGQLRTRLVPGEVHGPGDFRDVLGFSRKYLIPFLEYCDRAGITERRGGGRVLLATAGRSTAADARASAE